MADQILCHDRLERGVGGAGVSLVRVLERQPVLRESGLELLRVEFGLALKIFTRGLLLPQGEGRRDAFCEREGFGFRLRCGWLAGTAGTALAGRRVGALGGSISKRLINQQLSGE
jgi:hypothetical protein